LLPIKGIIDGQAKSIIKKSGAEEPGEPQIFTASNVPSNPGGNSWLRNVDSEYKMLNQLAADLGGVSGNTYPSKTGTLYIASDLEYCISCVGVIHEFNQMFPNIDLILVDGLK
jgi:hypothetical protein